MCIRDRSGRCTFSINENRPQNTIVGTVEVTDPDLPSVPNGMLTYSLQPQTMPFSVNLIGLITTTESLDREMRNSYTMTLSVSDSGITIQTTVIVMVNDLDDNNPVFIQAPNTIEVQENSVMGLEVTHYIARDNDIGANAEIIYSFASSSQVPFSINRITGVLSVSRAIDYEVTQSYTITVTASNPNNGNSAVSQVTTINIQNLNDNRPEFAQSPYTASIPEGRLAGSSVVTALATDADLGSFGVVSYSITDGNFQTCLLYTSPSPRDATLSRMPSSA